MMFSNQNRKKRISKTIILFLLASVIISSYLNCNSKSSPTKKQEKVPNATLNIQEKEAIGYSEEMKKDIIDNLKKNPNSAPAHHDYALLLLGEGNIEFAIKEFKRSISLSPENPISYLGLAEVYRKKGNFKKSYKYLKKALKLDNNNPSIYNQLAAYYLELGDYKNAKKYLELQKEKLLALEPGQVLYRDSFGNIFLFINNDREGLLNEVEEKLANIERK